MKRTEIECTPSCHPDCIEKEDILDKKKKIIRKRQKENANDKLKKWLTRL